MFVPMDIPPINEESKVINNNFYDESINKALESASMAQVYIRQVPNVKTEKKSKELSSRMARFKKAGLIGSLNNSGVTSSNYKEILSGSHKSKH